MVILVGLKLFARVQALPDFYAQMALVDVFTFLERTMGVF
jgi:hypothetical protein